mmetsp:Transcript_66160/g.111003  ORF Transcript_66160/g.111003 Transcript_66160/m.111003 type:complete len:90 (+) Transcript_66160:126-395(+)
MTTMWSALQMVDNRCAMAMVVRPTINRSIASCTSLSDSWSNADVASSSSKICGFMRMARAMARRCFCPPETLLFSTDVLHLSLHFMMKL